jgi:hypothetical protein
MIKRPMNEAVTHLFDEEVQMTGLVEYGVSWKDITSGKISPPAEGARFDLSFEGDLIGERVKGKIKGVDYLEFRADGCMRLNIQATIITHDGESIALHEGGLMTLNKQGGPADLHLNVTFKTHSQKYNWLNKANAWAIGQVDMDKATATISAYGNSKLPVMELN